MNRVRFGLAALALSALVTVAGCKSKDTGYYRVQDGSTGKSYLTTAYAEKADGQTTFTDSVTHKQITVLNAGIEQLDKGQWEDSMRRAKQNPSGNQ